MALSDLIAAEYKKTRTKAQRAALFAGNEFLGTTKEYVPVAFGALRESLFATEGDINEDSVEIRVGSNLEYSVEQHEDLLNHRMGYPITEGFEQNAAPNIPQGQDSAMRRYWSGYFRTKDKVRFKAKFLETPLALYAEEIADNIASWMRKN